MLRSKNGKKIIRNISSLYHHKNQMSSLQSGLSRFFGIKTAVYVLIFAVAIALWIYQKPHTTNTRLTQQRIDGTVQVCGDNDLQKCFDLEVAHTEYQREYGLMNRTGMALSSGMIFVFDTGGMYPFWMKNTLIPLDMLRVSETGLVVDIQTALPCTDDPCESYTPKERAKYVIELNAGISELLSIKIWTILHLKDM